MNIKPTKTWLKEHPPMKECPWKDTGCHCIFTMIDEDKHHTGYCIGFVGGADDLDILRICGSQPEGDSADINAFRVLTQATPAELAWLSAYIQVALATIFHLDSDYRTEMGKMRRRKTRSLNSQARSEKAKD